jgi:heat shock protein HtpX
MKNIFKTIFLLSILSILFVLIGSLLGGREGLYLGFSIALAINAISYFFSDKIALKSSGAKPLLKKEALDIYKMVEDLSKKMKLPMPKIFIIPSNQANAFATGRNPKNSSIAITNGLTKILSKDELEAVIAHELGHIKNRDVLIATVVAVLASSIVFVSRMGLWGGSDEKDRAGGLGIIIALLAPFAAMLIQLAISRAREYEADKESAFSLENSKPLSIALRKIHESVSRDPMLKINPAFSSLYIANPIKKTSSKFSNLFSTHPPVEERIKRLNALFPNN